MTRTRALLRRVLAEPDARFIAWVVVAALAAIVCAALGDHMAALDHLGVH